MSSPCNSLNVVPIKVSQLVKYTNIDLTDFILTVESGSALYSRKSTFGDVIHSLSHYTSSFSGSFTGSFKGKSSGSFSGSHYGLLVSKTAKVTGSFDGIFRSQDAKLSGSFSGSIYGKLVSKNAKTTGSFLGQLRSTDAKLSGSFSGSTYGKLLSNNAKITGSFRGSGSFFGLNYINNFKGTGKKVSFNGTASYAVSASMAERTVSLGNMPSSQLYTTLSPSTLDSYISAGYVYSAAHSFGATPSLVRATIICTNAGGDAGYSLNDEVGIENLTVGLRNTGNNLAAVWSNSTNVGVSFSSVPGGNILVITHKTSGLFNATITQNRWKIKIRAWS